MGSASGRFELIRSIWRKHARSISVMDWCYDDVILMMFLRVCYYLLAQGLWSHAPRHNFVIRFEGLRGKYMAEW